jgi:hypothetical protein
LHNSKARVTYQKVTLLSPGPESKDSGTAIATRDFSVSSPISLLEEDGGEHILPVTGMKVRPSGGLACITSAQFSEIITGCVRVARLSEYLDLLWVVLR